MYKINSRKCEYKICAFGGVIFLKKCVKLGGGKISNHNMKKSFQLMNVDYGSREVFVCMFRNWKRKSKKD